MAELADSPSPLLVNNSRLSLTGADQSLSRIANNQTTITHNDEASRLLDQSGPNINQASLKGRAGLNKTVNYGFGHTQRWQAQSEEGLI